MISKFMLNVFKIGSIFSKIIINEHSRFNGSNLECGKQNGSDFHWNGIPINVHNFSKNGSKLTIEHILKLIHLSLRDYRHFSTLR